MSCRPLCWTIFYALVSGLCSFSPARSHAQEAAAFASELGQLQASTDPASGSLKTGIPIRVPEYHGVEPKLALSYDSRGQNGLGGIGWRLDGFATIERASRGRGAPTYTSSDVFLLDGQELLPCSSASPSSPSCLYPESTGAGITYFSTTTESFLRIRYETSADQWTIWSKDGTKTILSSVYWNGPGRTFRWGINIQIDTRGNRVTYGWWCDPGSDCYPASVTYNGTIVSLYWEARPDPITFGNGLYLGRTSYRLKTVDVCVSHPSAPTPCATNGNEDERRARLYAISYKPNNSASGRSLLDNVRLYGTDARLTLSVNGQIVTSQALSGTFAPPETFTYTTATTAFDNTWNQATTAGATGIAYLSGDVNADGKSDIIQVWNNSGNVGVTLFTSSGTGFNPRSDNTPATRPYNGENVNFFFADDMSGDGKADLIHVYTHCKWGASSCGWLGWNPVVQIDTYVSTGTGFSSAYTTTTSIPAYAAAGYYVMDVNGDGKSDVVTLWTAGPGQPWYFIPYLSQGPSPAFAEGTRTQLLASPYYNTVWPADVNGDGKGDIVLQPKDTPLGTIHTYIAGANGSFAPPIAQAVTLPSGRLATIPMDFNGDGKTDLISLHDSAGSLLITPIPSYGNGFLTAPSSIATGQSSSALRFFRADVNGDGRADLLKAADYGGLHLVTYVSTGTSFAAAVDKATGQGAGNVALLPLDYTGDGKTDFAQLWSNSGWLNILQYRSGGEPTDLMSSFANGIGGWTSITYSPSSAHPNTNLPGVLQTVSSISVYDGHTLDPIDPGSLYRASTTLYGYSGGLYDWGTRRFLGFREVTTSLPRNDGDPSGYPLRVTVYRQDPRSGPLPQEMYQYDHAGRLLRATISTYITTGGYWEDPCFGSGTDPYKTLETQRTEYVYDGSGTICTWPAWPNKGACAYGRRIIVTRVFDVFGNAVREVFYGDYDVDGDEKNWAYWYNPNFSQYIVGTISSASQYDGLTTKGALLQKTLYYYDQDAGGAAPPFSPNATPPYPGNLTTVLRWLDTTNSYQPSYFEYDSAGNLERATDALGFATSYAYDQTFHVFLESETNAAGLTTSATWDARHDKPKDRTDANGQKTYYAYDALGRLYFTTLPLGGWESRSYCAIGSSTNPCGSADPGPGTYGTTYAAQHVEVQTPSADGSSSQWSRTYFDGLGRTWRTASKGPSSTKSILVDSTYTRRGTLSSQTAPYYSTGEEPRWTSFSYDGFDRVSRVTMPDGAFVTKQYALGKVTTKDALGHPQTDTIDVFGNLVQHDEVLNGAPLTTAYRYDARGYPSGITDPTGLNSWSSHYDSLGRRTATTDPDKGSAAYQYDALDRLEWTQDAEGHLTVFGYDPIGRQETKTIDGVLSASWAYDEIRPAPAGSPTYCIVNGINSYCNKGRLTSLFDSSGSATFNYDARGTLVHTTRVIDGKTYPFSFGFDAGGYQRWTTYPDGDTVGNTSNQLQYDGAGRLYKVPGILDEIQYDARGRPTYQKNINSTRTKRIYDPKRGWLKGIATCTGGDPILDGSGRAACPPTTTKIQELNYDYDLDGRLTSQTSPFPLEGWAYGYDELERLKSATSHSGSTHNQSFDYDTIGNLTTKRVGDIATTYSYPLPGSPRPHAVQSVAGQPYAYNANGALYSGGGRTITYHDNRPVRIVSGSATLDLSYDAEGERLSKTVGATTTHYVGRDYEITNGLSTKYIWAGGERVAQRTGLAGAQVTSWLHTDRLGSVNVITDAAGLETGRQTYGPYGEALSTTGAQGNLGYIGERLDESGLLYLHARYYDPSLGRFISPDPVLGAGQLGGLNRYAYGSNDPVNHRDPNGEFFGLFDWLADHGVHVDWGIGAGFGYNTPLHDPRAEIDGTTISTTFGTYDEGRSCRGPFCPSEGGREAADAAEKRARKEGEGTRIAGAGADDAAAPAPSAQAPSDAQSDDGLAPQTAAGVTAAGATAAIDQVGRSLGTGAADIAAGGRAFVESLAGLAARAAPVMRAGGAIVSLIWPSPTGEVVPDYVAYDPTKTAIPASIAASSAGLVNILAAEHTKNARPSTKQKHEQGQATKKKSRGGEKGDVRRDHPRKRPEDWKGPWPPPKHNP